MGEFRIGTAISEPAIGALKVGSTDIQEIYVGTNKIWPSVPLCPGAEEVQIGNLIWKTANTESLSGSSGDILYYPQIGPVEAQRVLAEEIPAAVLYLGGPGYIEYGLYYNKYAARDIIPPTGFRLPTDADFENLNNELQQLFNEGDNGVTSIGGGEINRWGDLVQGNYYFGRSCFNSRGVGLWYQNGSNKGGSSGGIYWTQEQADLSGTTNQLVRFDSSTARIKKITGFVTNGTFAPIRFCKDAPVPGEVQIGNLIWTDANTSILDKSSSGQITIATSEAEAISAYNSQTPAAIYYNFDSANANRGLFYNKWAAAVITPPLGFRLPNTSDFNNLNNEIDPSSTSDFTAIGGGDINFWPTDIQNNPSFGTSGFDAIRAGFGYLAGSSSLFFSPDWAMYWDSDGLSTEINPAYYQSAFGQIDYTRQSLTPSAGKYVNIRFCKDA